MIKPRFIEMTFGVSALLGALMCSVGEGAEAPVSPTKNPEVLDFENEVIEGERRTPDMFLQIEVPSPAMDAMFYQRDDFNDFHVLDRHKRPRYGQPLRNGAPDQEKK